MNFLSLHFYPDGTYSTFNKLILTEAIVETRCHSQRRVWEEKGDCCFGPSGKKIDLIIPTKLGPVCWSSSHTTILSTVGTLNDGYIHNGPFPRVPWIQSASPTMSHALIAQKAGTQLPGVTYTFPVGFPQHCKRRGIKEVTATPFVTPSRLLATEACPNTLGAPFTHAWEQSPCFLHGGGS